MKAIIYARYSSDNQREESIEGQIRECMEFAERNGITVFGTYIDRALSAKTDNRPEFQRMIKDSYRKLFDTVLVWKLDRFARNRYDSAYYKNILKKNGVKVISAKENISDGPEGVLLESMLEGWAEYYSVDLSEKIGRGLTENALKGKMNGGGLTFGYRMKDQRLEIDETTAPVVVEIFTRYADGERMTDIAKDLTRRGIRTSQGNKITLNVVHYLLKNRRYIGEYKFRDMTIPDAIPPIVSEELFNRVQEIMARNQKAPAMRKAEDDYILTTRLFCGKCGTFMVGESGKSHMGTVHRYYKCSHAKRKMGCDKKPVKKDWIEDAVIHYIMKIVMDDELIDRIADAILNILAQENSKLPQLNTRLKEIETGIQNMLNAIQQGILTPSTKERLEALEQEREEIKVAIYSEELQKPKITKEHIAFWISKFRDTDLTDIASRKRLVESFVNAVFVYDDKVVFTFNYKDGSKTATVDEINAELGSDLDGTTPPREKAPFIGCLFLWWRERRTAASSSRGGKATGGTACRKIIGKNMKIDIVEKLTPRMTEALVRLWEASVRATHDFLTESEIGRIGAYVPEALQSVRHLAVAREEDGSAAAFPGVEGRRIGMLFVAPEQREKGIGRALVLFAAEEFAADEVTVNEQNVQAVGFYKKMGFVPYRRTQTDEQGGPYPLLYMKR